LGGDRRPATGDRRSGDRRSGDPAIRRSGDRRPAIGDPAIRRSGDPAKLARQLI